MSEIIPITIFVVFCPERLAIVLLSGIITTNLGKTATLTGIAGREKTDTSLQNMPFFLTEEGHFFYLVLCRCKIYKRYKTVKYTDVLMLFLILLRNNSKVVTHWYVETSMQCYYQHSQSG
ncbi:MAG: hypothetical protein GQ538_09825 [Xanthomonadales bacterium]|nr:hypothetical protein [Xanthomonadales bacterium]